MAGNPAPFLGRTPAIVEIPNAWQLLANGQRFPVAYLETEDMLRRLALDPDTLDWQRLVSDAPRLRVAPGETPVLPAPDAAEPRAGGFTKAIAEAKRKLADSLGIASEKIEITIRL